MLEMSLLHGVTDILSHLLTDQIDFFLLSFVCLHCYLAESSIAQYSYSIKSFCLELLHPERQVVSDWWSLAVIILDCFSDENFESKREFVAKLSLVTCSDLLHTVQEVVRVKLWKIIAEGPNEW